MWQFCLEVRFYVYSLFMHFNYTATDVDAIDDLGQVLFVKQIVSLWDIPSIQV